MRAIRLLSLLVLSGSVAAAASAADRKPVDDRLQAAREVLQMSVTAPDKGIPKDLLERAECVGVFPGVKKAAFVVGGDYGHGLFTCREKDGTMGPPALFTLGGGSLGWQFGGEEADLVLLIMNEDGLKHLLEDHFTLGGGASAVAGPVGRTAVAATDAQMHAEILSWSRSRGIFLGASLEGTVIRQDRKGAEDLYGRPVSAAEILTGGKVTVPASALPFVEETSRYARRSS